MNVQTPSPEPVLLGGFLGELGTRNSLMHSRELLPRSNQTGAGIPLSMPDEVARDLTELRRRTGLTWEQLARLFNVSRRAVHFWASGKAMTADHEERLKRVIAVVRQMDRGSASENRAVLLSPDREGRLPFDLLAAGAYETARTLLGASPLRTRPMASPVNERVRDARRPQPPEVLAEALQDRVHEASGRLLGAKRLKARRGE